MDIALKSDGNCIQGISKWRQQQLSNEYVSYFVENSVPTNIIHDKTCQLLKSKSDYELMPKSEYDSSLKQCKECALKAYLRIKANGMKDYNAYETFFKRAKVDDNQLRSMYVDKGMETRIHANVMTVWFRKDTWQIISLDKDGHVQLKHNNYQALKNNERRFTGGFHVQNAECNCTNFQKAFGYIKNYKYSDHSAPRVDTANKTPSETENKKRDEIKKTNILDWVKEKWKAFCEWRQDRIFFIRKSDFIICEKRGMPNNGSKCLFIYQDKSKVKHYETGWYNTSEKKFYVWTKGNEHTIKANKVISWIVYENLNAKANID